MADWYYIGHYGQLGPLTRDQMDELIQGGVVNRDTYVWRNGMAQWLPAGTIGELDPQFRLADPFVAPPPPPTYSAAPPASNPQTMPAPVWTQNPYLAHTTLKSDRSRTVSGVLQIFVPGVGRMYLGYMAYGVLQLVVFFCTFGLGYLWSLIDGIVILSGGVKLDGYGRSLTD